MTCEVDWVTRDMFKNILSIGITKSNNKVLGADTEILEFEGKEKDLETALKAKGYYLDKRYEYKDCVKNKDHGRIYLGRELVYLKEHGGMLFAHGQNLGSYYDIDCVYNTLEYTCLLNNGLGIVYKVYSDRVELMKLSAYTGFKLYNYQAKLFYIDNGDLVIYSILQDCEMQRFELDKDIKISCINKDSAYVLSGGRFRTIRIDELLGGTVSC